MPDMHLSLRNLPDDLRKSAEEIATAIGRSVPTVSQVYYLCSTRSASEQWSCFPELEPSCTYDSLFSLLVLLDKEDEKPIEEIELELESICQTRLQTINILAVPLVQAYQLAKAGDRFYGRICRKELLLFHDGLSPLPKAIAPEHLNTWSAEDEYCWKSTYNQGKRFLQEAAQHLNQEAWEQTVLTLRQANACFLVSVLFSTTGCALPLHRRLEKLFSLTTLFTQQVMDIFPNYTDEEELLTALLFHTDKNALAQLNLSQHIQAIHGLIKRITQMQDIVQELHTKMQLLAAATP